MSRALFAVCLLASPAAAQVDYYVNPYNPYASSIGGEHDSISPVRKSRPAAYRRTNIGPRRLTTS